MPDIFNRVRNTRLFPSWRTARFLTSSLAIALSLMARTGFAGESIAIVDAFVIDGTGAPARESQTILIDGDTIVAVGDSRNIEVPGDSRVIDANGQTVIPGIVGVHNHLHYPGTDILSYTAPRLYLGAGVTTISTVGSADMPSEIRLARQIRSGQVPGPRIITSGPYITGPGRSPLMEGPVDTDSAQQLVDHLATSGVRWLKLYRHIEPDIARVVIARAHKHGIRVAAHLCSLTFREAIDMGIDSIEHGLTSMTDFHPDKLVGNAHRTIFANSQDSPTGARRSTS